MWLLPACCVAVLLVAVAARAGRQAGARPWAQRVAPGARVTTRDGVIGSVLEHRDGIVLLALDGGRTVWAERSSLLTWSRPPPSLPSRLASQPGAPPSEAHQLASDPGHLSPPEADGSGPWPRLGGAIARRPALMLVAAVFVAGASVPLAATLEAALSGGGYMPDGSEAQAVADAQRDTFGVPVTTITVLATGTPPEVAGRLAAARADLDAVPHLEQTGRPVPTPDRRHVAVTFGFGQSDDQVRDSVDPLQSALEDAGLRDPQLAGGPVIYRDMAYQTKRDLARAETIGIPIALIVLLIVFGTFPAALVPMVVGAVSVLVSLALLHLVARERELSIYVMNIASMLGFGLGIDYSLLSVTRFRAELARHGSVQRAVTATVATAGKAGVVSGTAVLGGLSCLALFPLGVLQSIAIGGAIVTVVTVVASVTLLPALLALLGPRIERLAVRRSSADPAETSLDRSRWLVLAHAVMARPALAIALGVLLLVLLGRPVLGTTLDVPHSEALPASAPSRVAAKALETAFGRPLASPTVVMLDTDDRREVAAYARTLRALPGVASVRGAGVADGTTLLQVVPKQARDGGGPAAREVVARVRDADAPARVRLGGQAPGEIEFLAAIADHAPRAIAVAVLLTFAILLVCFRSLLLPIKAVVLDGLSIIASLGVVVAVFQDGHGAGLLGASGLGYTEATMPIVLFAVLFGLSMDYEVFMLAGIAERYGRGASNADATARGMAATAPLVTGAALILIAIGVAFASTELVLVKQLGFGLAVALVLDATIVRCLLLPATMRLLGDRNWWLPWRVARYVPRVDWAH